MEINKTLDLDSVKAQINEHFNTIDRVDQMEPLIKGLLSGEIKVTAKDEKTSEVKTLT